MPKDPEELGDSPCGQGHAVRSSDAPALVMAPLRQAVLEKHSSRDMVKPGFSGPGSALLPRQEEGSRAPWESRARPAAHSCGDPMGQQHWRGSVCTQRGTGDPPGLWAHLGTRIGDLLLLLHSAKCCGVPSAARPCCPESHFLCFPWEPGWWVPGLPSLPGAQRPWEWQWCFTTSGVMPLGEAFARPQASLLVPAPGQHCWSQVTSGHRGGWSRGQAQS